MAKEKEVLIKLMQSEVANLHLLLSRVDIKGKEAFVLCGIINKLEQGKPIEEEVVNQKEA